MRHSNIKRRLALIESNKTAHIDHRKLVKHRRLVKPAFIYLTVVRGLRKTNLTILASELPPLESIGKHNVNILGFKKNTCVRISISPSVANAIIVKYQSDINVSSIRTNLVVTIKRNENFKITPITGGRRPPRLPGERKITGGGLNYRSF
ncbi:hypothetical protein [Clostridium sp. AM58-1XD]|uniref:hypothetical protein n=1 Tax=Clostridium sp. AM58-1XD TaxID=2292307 RepID=UPI000E49AAD9|nr:hypothetical protein [Clostridium sp. AM58-1XD]RGY98603.1 hypothetical protein DXA13_11030 [Clostridium sp. AM58-1XD]